MALYDQAGFRITLWPANRLPHPGWGRTVDYRLDRELELIVWSGEWSDGPPPRDDGEAYLRLAALDLDDLDMVDAWLRSYGALHMFEPEGIWCGFTLHDGWEPVREHLEAEMERGRRTVRAPDIYTQSLAEFRWGAGCIKDLVTAWRVVSGELALAAAEWVAPLWQHSQAILEDYPWEDYGIDDGTHISGAAGLLSLYLTDGLSGFAPRVMTRPSATDSPFAVSEIWSYGLLCLELFNHIVEQTGYRSCQNEKCGRLFVRQSGRARHGQHRQHGVLYCSPECARAQAQRQYRRRKSAALRAARQHDSD